MVEVSGTCEPGFGPVADAFRVNFDERRELGAACAVVQDGNVVVDLWGGHLDRARSRPWCSDSLVTVFSTTKGMAAAAMAVAHSRGLFDLDQPVCRYWPEFEHGGKGDVTVAQLLAHEAGLAVIDEQLDLDTIADFDRLGAILARQRPAWPPGSAHGYHAQTLGWYESQLIARVDPAGRRIGRFFAEEVAGAAGVEFHIGLPPDVAQDRVATFSGGTRLGQALHARQAPWPVLRRLLNPRSATFKAFTNPRALTKLTDVNRREILDLELPSVNGTGTARAVATIYGDLAAGGRRLGVDAATLARIEEAVPPALDRIFGIESAFSFGFMKPFPDLPFGSSARAYGHTGSGGSFGYADPDRRLGYCYAMNRAGYSLPTDPRELALRTAVDSCAG